MQKIFSLRDLSLRDSTVLVRVDYNVPLEGRRILDDRKIKASLPTINYLLAKNCKIILATHLGRPEGKIKPELGVEPLAEELKKLLPKRKIVKLDDCLGEKIKKRIGQGKKGELFLLENLRFYLEEEQNNPGFAWALASLADFYVDDGFAVSHRKAASVEAITHFLPSAAGLLMEKEVEALSQALKPKKPFVWLIGGTKLDKIDLIEEALKKADHILIGGALAFSFLKAKGFQVGMSKTDVQSIKLAKKILSLKGAEKIILPLDVVVASDTNPNAEVRKVKVDQIPTDKIGLDLGPETVELFKKYLQKAKTIVWNGPLGYFEVKPFDKASREIAVFISKRKGVRIIGGGETSEAIEKFGLAKKMTWVSTGGGASLEFLSGKKLPGITALERNYRKYFGR